jgi:hypothetical protein
MVQLPTAANNFDPKAPIRPIHFRPIRYEVQAEVDKLFGLSQMQKRQLALRHRDEDGRLWFDGLEEEEFRHLLQPRSIPSSPMSPFNNDFSRRSSTATGISNSVPSSPTNPFFTPTGNSFENGFTRRRSSISTNLLLQFDDSIYLQRRKSVPFLPLTAMLEKETNLETEPSVQPAQQAKKVDSVPIYKRRRNKRSRSNDDLHHVQSKNKVFLGRLNAEEENLFEDNVKSRTRERFQTTETEIIMPNFLPIPRHHLDGKKLEEAFGPSQKGSDDRMNEESITTKILEHQSPSSSIRSSPSPTSLQYEVVRLGSDTDKLNWRSRTIDEGECISPNSKVDNSINPMVLNTKSAFKPKKERRNTTFITADIPKAAAMLGMTANNEKLLVPGGLGTGEHVYDGVEIPCASVRLQSDDEEEEDEEENVKNTSRGLRTKFDRQKDRMKRALH